MRHREVFGFFSICRNPSMLVVLYADTRSIGRSFVRNFASLLMPQSAVDKIPTGPKLDALTAERFSAAREKWREEWRVAKSSHHGEKIFQTL